MMRCGTEGLRSPSYGIAQARRDDLLALPGLLLRFAGLMPACHASRRASAGTLSRQAQTALTAPVTRVAIRCVPDQQRLRS
jgi:hypothetical protein